MRWGHGAAFAALVLAMSWRPGAAHAVELYWNGTVVTPLPQPVVVVPQPTPRPIYVVRPAPYVIRPAPVRIVQPTRITLSVQAPVQPAPVVVDDGGDNQASVEHDPYQTGGLLIAGAGAGGVFFLGDGVNGVAAGYRLHLGLAVDAAEFALRFDLVPDAIDIQSETGEATSASLYTAGATFNYRFLPGATVHPVAGVGLESVFVDAQGADSSTAFAVTGRAGAELAYPLSDGALALGIDVTGHHVLGKVDGFPLETVDMLTFGAYADYRF